MSLATAIFKAVTTSLRATLPASAAEKFNLDENEFKDFLDEFLTIQLKSVKGGRSGGRKGTDGKGPRTGYIVFCTDTRPSLTEQYHDLVPKDRFLRIGKELGKMWGALTDEEKGEWNLKAADLNDANNCPPAKGKTAAMPKGKAAPAKGKGKAAPAKGKGKGKAAPAKEKAATPKTKFNSVAKKWVVEGMNFVVQNATDKTIIGKLRGGKVINLSAVESKT